MSVTAAKRKPLETKEEKKKKKGEKKAKTKKEKKRVNNWTLASCQVQSPGDEEIEEERERREVYIN